MTTTLRIASVNTDAVLSIEMMGVEDARVSFEAIFATGHVRVWFYDGTHSLVDFFRSMAVDWHGWLGSKQWSSMEGECSLEATTDRGGHITIKVTLQSGDGAE